MNVGEDPEVAVVHRRAIKGFVWSAASFGTSKILVFLSTVVLAHLLAPTDFGVVTAATAILAYLELGLDLGVGSVLIFDQEHGVTPRVDTALVLNLVVSTGLFLIGVSSAPLIANFFHVPGEAWLFRVLAFSLVLRGAAQVNLAVLKRDLLFRNLLVIDITRAMTKAVTAVALAVVGLGPGAIVGGILAGDLAGTAISWCLVPHRPRLRVDAAVAANLVRLGSAFVLLRLIDTALYNADYLVVGSVLGAAPLGYYTIAFRLPEMVIDSTLSVFSSVAFPAYSKTRAHGVEAFKRTMLAALELTTLFGFAAGAGLAILSRDAVTVLFSPRWEPAVGPMALISLALGLHAIGYASGDIFTALGRPGLLVKIDGPMTVLLVTALIGAAPLGITAVAAVHLVFVVAYALVRLAVANRILHCGFRESLAVMRPGACATLGVVLCALPVRLLTAPGPAALVEIGLAVAGGACLGLAVGSRPTLARLGDLARQALTR